MQPPERAWLDAANRRYDDAVAQASAMIDAGRRSGDVRGQAEGELVWAIAAINATRFAEVEVHVERLFEQLRRAPDAVFEGYGWMLRAIAGVRQQRTDQALEFLLHAESALANTEAVTDRSVLLVSNIASAYSLAELYEKADCTAESAIAAATEAQLRTPVHYYRRARNLLAWAVRCEHLERTSQAAELYAAAVDTYTSGLSEPPDDRFTVERDVAELATVLVESRRVRLLGGAAPVPAKPVHADVAEVRDWQLHALASRALAVGDPRGALELLAQLDTGLPVLLGMPMPDRHFLRALAHEMLGEHAGALAAHRAMHRLYDEAAYDSRPRRLDAARSRLETVRLHSAARQYATESLTDPLTGLPNRRHLDAALAELPAVAQPGDYEIVLLDLDSFKEVNDRFGHLVGDQVLAAAAGVLRGELRGRDLLARYGGDEFVLVVTHPGAEAEERFLQRLGDAVAGHDWHGILPGLHITVTCGAAISELGDRPAEVLDRADRRLLAAKQVR